MCQCVDIADHQSHRRTTERSLITVVTLGGDQEVGEAAGVGVTEMGLKVQVMPGVARADSLFGRQDLRLVRPEERFSSFVQLVKCRQL